MKIELGKSESGEKVFIDIPTLVATRMLVAESSGGGKSEILRRILEEAGLIERKGE
jgi:DNA helicase HerA-like ATPase